MKPYNADAKSASSTSAPRRFRSPGRPAGEGDDLRQRLLDASVSCFARQGIVGSSLREIAAEAGATPAMLHYYFGGKDALRFGRQPLILLNRHNGIGKARDNGGRIAQPTAQIEHHITGLG